MFKLFFIPLMFIKISQSNWTLSKNVLHDVQKFRSALFVNTLEYQLIADGVEIDYCVSGCFNVSFYKMKINKMGSNFYMKVFFLNSPDYEGAQEKYLKGQGESFVVKLSRKDIINLKGALVEKRGYSTMHNYITIKQGDHIYELMDNNPSPPMYGFIEGLKEKKHYKAKYN